MTPSLEWHKLVNMWQWVKPENSQGQKQRQNHLETEAKAASAKKLISSSRYGQIAKGPKVRGLQLGQWCWPLSSARQAQKALLALPSSLGTCGDVSQYFWSSWWKRPRAQGEGRLEMLLSIIHVHRHSPDSDDSSSLTGQRSRGGELLRAQYFYSEAPTVFKKT